MTAEMDTVRDILGMPLTKLEMVTIWRIVSKDPDEITERTGVLVYEDADEFRLVIGYNLTATPFWKSTPAGVTKWRRA